MSTAQDVAWPPNSPDQADPLSISRFSGRIATRTRPGSRQPARPHRPTWRHQPSKRDL